MIAKLFGSLKILHLSPNAFLMTLIDSKFKTKNHNGKKNHIYCMDAKIEIHYFRCSTKNKRMLWLVIILELCIHLNLNKYQWNMIIHLSNTFIGVEKGEHSKLCPELWWKCQLMSVNVYVKDINVLIQFVNT